MLQSMVYDVKLILYAYIHNSKTALVFVIKPFNNILSLVDS